MVVFAARSSETSFACLLEQSKTIYPKRGKSGIYYPPNWLTCKFCNTTFKKRSLFRTHKNESHPESMGDNEVVCQFCPKYFSNRAMMSHMKGKHSDKVLEWIPKKQTMNKTKIRRSKTNKPTPFQCKLCKKYVTTKTALRYHMITHMEEKPYKCIPCNFDFSQKSHYNTHLGKYHPEINTNQPTEFQCKLCHKYFDENRYLKIHMASHRREQTKSLVDIEFEIGELKNDN